MLKAGGAHNVGNALAAAAAASAAGPPWRISRRAWQDFRAVAGRLQLKAGARGSWIIDDSYNANPSSVRAGDGGAADAARRDAGSCSATWRSSANQPRTATRSIGAYARDCGVKRLFAFGPLSSRAAETFGSGAEWFADADSLTRRLQAETHAGRDGADQGLARQPPGARRAGAHRRRRGRNPMMRAS